MTTILTPRGRLICGVQVVQTLYTVPHEGLAYYEVHVAAPTDEDPAILLTRDRAVYQQAEDAYGTGESVDCEWASRTLNGHAVRALLAIRRGV